MMFGKSAEMMSDGVIEGWGSNSEVEQKESHSTGRREARGQEVSTEMTDIKCKDNMYCICILVMFWP